MNTLQKELNCFLVGKSRTWPPLILTAPFITQKIGFEKYASGPEILAKTSQNIQVWFGDPDFGTFCFEYHEPHKRNEFFF